MPLSIDVWSDIACPWCYVGKRRLEGALALFEHRDEVEVRWHAFELDPSAPPEVDRSMSYPERLARKYRMGVAEAQGWMDRMTEQAAEDGIEMRFDRLRAGNTLDAHRVLCFAAEAGVKGEMKERLLRAYFTEGELMSDHGALSRLAADVGLDPDDVAGVLATDRYTDEVRHEESAAAQLGITGVPFFVFGGQFGVSGAQPVETLVPMLERAFQSPVKSEVVADGAVCGPDGC